MSDVKAAKDERRGDYKWWMPVASRWSDCDAYGHVNNAVYYTWFDTSLTTLAIESSHGAVKLLNRVKRKSLKLIKGL